MLTWLYSYIEGCGKYGQLIFTCQRLCNAEPFLLLML